MTITLIIGIILAITAMVGATAFMAVVVNLHLKIYQDVVSYLKQQRPDIWLRLDNSNLIDRQYPSFSNIKYLFNATKHFESQGDQELSMRVTVFRDLSKAWAVIFITMMMIVIGIVILSYTPSSPQRQFEAYCQDGKAATGWRLHISDKASNDNE